MRNPKEVISEQVIAEVIQEEVVPGGVIEPRKSIQIR